jgi:hydroxyethylthiazole kinase-like uncharacterized protein yjeF
VKWVYNTATIRDAERAAMEHVPPGQLMQRAASALSSACVRLLGGVYGARVVLLVGSGDNGGDALFAGARLARRGARVHAVLLGEAVHAQGLAAFVAAGGRSAGDRPDILIADAELVIDGIVGIGGHGGLRPPAAALVRAVGESPAAVVAVDLPSGVDADTGQTSGEAVWADVTVTFGALKPGLVMAPGSWHAGVVEIVDLGLSLPDAPPGATLAVLEPSDVAHVLPRPHPDDDKYSAGVPGIAAGGTTYPGAAVLATGGAVYAKSGLVRFAGRAATEVVAAFPSVIVSSGLPSEAGSAQAWAVGPGIGTDQAARALLDDVLGLDVPVVVDADGLTLLAKQLAGDPDLLRRRAQPCVLTPHRGEFGRLAADLDPRADPIGAARQLAERVDATVLLKGDVTVVADPGGMTYLNPTGTPRLASAGTGDVLTGIITALLASGLDPALAAATGAFLHGLAGRLASREAPTTSRDLVDALPEASRLLFTSASMEE